MPPTDAPVSRDTVRVWNVLTTILQVAGLAIVGVGLWLLQPLLLVGVVLAGVGFIAAPDR